MIRCDFDIPLQFSALIVDELRKFGVDDCMNGRYTLSFCDPNYDRETGGYHPVEIAVVDGEIEYVTDFAYYGEDLEKELDFDFGQGLFQQALSGCCDIKEGRELFNIYVFNFVSYYNWGVYKVTITEG